MPYRQLMPIEAARPEPSAPPEQIIQPPVELDPATTEKSEDFYLDTLEYPCFAMSFPFNLSNEVQNNAWMKDSDNAKPINFQKAYTQWLNLYQVLVSGGLVYLAPSTPGLQDEVYIANMGMVIPDHIEPKTFILSNFRSQPREGEEDIGRDFFDLMQFHVLQTPAFWEGEADLKFVHDNIFVGGWGIRTDPMAYKFIEMLAGVSIIPVHMTDEKLYHFDCMFFPVDKENALVATEIMDSADVKAIEKVVNIIPVEKDFAYQGATNCVRVGNLILNASPIDELKKDDDKYDLEQRRINWMEKTIGKLGQELVIVNLSEFEKSGAALSCNVMHLNYWDYK